MTQPQPSLHPLAHRLLLALGISASPGCWWIGGDCDVPPERVRLDLDRTESDTGAPDSGVTYSEPLADCPEDEATILALASANDVYINHDSPIDLVAQDGRACVYAYTPLTCCGYGRPYLDEDGQPVEAATRPTPAWSRGTPVPDLAGLSAPQRAALARFWRKNAQAEHSSVAGFHRFALELLSLGAPPALVARAQAAAAQELHHAQLCFGLAGAFAGAALGPAPMALGAAAPLARDLVELAVFTLRDGAIGETVAAFLAEEALEHTTDPAVRQVLATIVRDETGHAELAWATVQWALEVGGAPVRRALEGFLAQLDAPVAREAEGPRAVPSHGLPTPEAEAAAAARCLVQVVRPVATALLGARAA